MNANGPMNSLYLEYINKNPYDNIKYDIKRLYKRARTRPEKISLYSINQIMISKYVDFEEPYFTYNIDDLIRDAEEYGWNKLVNVLNKLNNIERPVTKEKFNSTLAKANEDYDLNNNNVKNLEKLVYLGPTPVGNNKRNNKQGAIWIGKIDNNELNRGGRRKTYKRHSTRRSKRRHTRRN
jgi:hypothetical protein